MDLNITIPKGGNFTINLHFTEKPIQDEEKRANTKYRVAQPKQEGQLQLLEIEEAILGSMLSNTECVARIRNILSPDTFHKKEHQIICAAIFKIFDASEAIDLLVVSNHLKETGNLEFVGGHGHLLEMAQKAMSLDQIIFYARAIVQNNIQRLLVKASNEITEGVKGNAVDALELLEVAKAKLSDINMNNPKDATNSTKNLVPLAKKLMETNSKKDGISGVLSGFRELDRLTSGWQAGNLILIGGRPGMGKTAFALSMIRNMAVKANIPVAYFSLYESSIQIITRLLASETALSSEKLRTGKLERHEWELLGILSHSLSEAPLFINDTPSLSIAELKIEARKLTIRHDIKLIMIDYLQLMSSGNQSRVEGPFQEASNILRNLKTLARMLDIPIIVLSQLSRSLEFRKGINGHKRPLLVDIPGGEAVEAHADVVCFIYRPEYYKIEEWDDADNSYSDGQAEIIVAKHRNGGLDNIRLKFYGAVGKFEDPRNP